MIHHYLKVAFRNMWKYKSQTLISVAGLAVGFACFAMATLWIRYEMTYDSFHKNADRLYRVSIKDEFGAYPDGMANSTALPLAPYLKKTFPEINSATRIIGAKYTYNVEIDSIKSGVKILWIDSSFFKIFDVRIVEGTMDFLVPANNQLAVTREKAVQLFGKENPIGKTVGNNAKQYTVGAVVNGFAKHSNYKFDMLGASTSIEYGSVVVELVKGIDMDAFGKKLYEYKATAGFPYLFPDGIEHVVNQNVEKIVLMPLTSIHYKDNQLWGIKFQNQIVFAIAGSLLILCTLFNCLTLFVSRFRIRMKEFALRIVCGASNRSLFMLLSVEFAMSLIAALLLGVFLIQALMPHFVKLSGVDIESYFIYAESSIYIGIVILISLLAFLLVLYVFRRRTLNVVIHKNNNKIFRKTSIVAQLIISIGFAFCTVIILKQIYYLHNTDLGFSMKNRGTISIHVPSVEAAVFENQMREIPEIEETVAGYFSLMTFKLVTKERFDWDERPADVEPISMLHSNVSEKFVNFYDFKFVAGEMLNENDSKEYVLINETAAKIFGWKNPAGKTFTGKQDDNSIAKYTVKGVLQDIHCFEPTTPVQATVYRYSNKGYHNGVLFKYREGTWKTCKNKIMELIQEKYPDAANNIHIENEEESYGGSLKAENTLLTILTVISLVCMTVCVFGFVSMVSLTCEERRKEIAIRKINGATIKDILDIFFKEHLTLLVIGAIIAFPAGYIVMKRWLEQYVLQTEISAWIYLSILLALFMAIVMCIGGRVYKTSRENPIKAITS
jgi:uncharacterized membrane protein